ncbi:hypothetical protein GCM10009087_40240 [Sphingomonas oligophenolica]|uniref:DUF2029 domain-containing protein n=1 Tax=Sphingomonas oligophenolica TaxID=301154 RepID=A0ABU9Y238_9SPHN
MALAIVIALVYDFWYFFTYKYFPQPFFYDIGDTWMDWFNPAYWSHVPGAYDSYRTIYPPLTYVILKAITWGPCYPGAQGGWARECDAMGIISLHLVYVLCIVLTARTLLRVDRRTALPRSLAISLGLPMLWALDRGNVILITYIFMLLAYGPLLQSARLRWLFAGLAVNMKVYLIGTVAAQLLHRRWRWAEGALVASVLVYLVTYALFGSGNPVEIYHNITDYADGLVINNPLDIWMASTLLPLQQLTHSDVFPTLLVLGSRLTTLIDTLVPLIMHSAQAIIMIGAFACFLRPEVVPRSRMLVLSVGLAVISTEVSGYTEIIVLLFTFMEPARGFLRRYALVAAYLVCIPFDINIDSLPPLAKESFFFGTGVIVEYVVQLGPFIRPLATLSIPVSLALLTIIDVWRDIRLQGWAGRWRFRHDVPLLPSVLPPLRPTRAEVARVGENAPRPANATA